MQSLAKDVGMTPFTCIVGFLPLTLYFLYVSRLNSYSHPVVVSGTKDNVALALGLSGFVLVGPGQLIMPVGALIDKGLLAWILLLALYLLLVLFFSGFLRHRIVLYNTSPEQVRSLIAELAFRKELEIQWLGDTLDLPKLGVHLTMETMPLFCHVSLVASGKQGQPGGWSQLETSLREVVVASPSGTKTAFRFFFAISLVMLVIITLVGTCCSEAVLQGFFSFF